MKRSLLPLILLFLICILLPIIFRLSEGMTVTKDADGNTKYDYTNNLDTENKSTTMDPNEDIDTQGSQLPSNFFDSVRTGPYYKDDGEDESKYISRSKNFKGYTDSQGKPVGENSNNVVDAANVGYYNSGAPKNTSGTGSSSSGSGSSSSGSTGSSSSGSGSGSSGSSSSGSSSSGSGSSSSGSSGSSGSGSSGSSSSGSGSSGSGSSSSPKTNVEQIEENIGIIQRFINLFKQNTETFVTRRVTDTSNNPYDISANYELYNEQGALKMGKHDATDYGTLLTNLEKEYKELENKFKNSNSPIKCIADFATDIGEDLCCGQTGVLQNTKYVCPSEKPTCSNFKCGSKFGSCM